MGFSGQMLNWGIKNFSPLGDLKVNGYTCKREKGQNLRTAGEPCQHWILFEQVISKPCGHLKRARVFGSKIKRIFLILLLQMVLNHVSG